MKSKTFGKKLTLNKKTIADLTIGKMRNVHGGKDKPPHYVETYTCGGTSCYCTGTPPCIIC
jgi:hypothetical protein